MKKFLPLLLLLFVYPLYGQTSQTGKIVIATSSTLPLTCSPADVATTTDNFALYECGPVNTWVLHGTPAAATWPGLPGGVNNSSSFICGTGCSISTLGTGTNTATNGLNSVVNDTNVTGTLSGEILTLGWTGALGVTRGGIGVGTLSGIAKGNGTSAFSAAINTDITALFTGTCNSTTFMRGDGSCQAVSVTNPVFQTNASPLSNQATINYQNSTSNSVGLSLNVSNPSAGNVKYEITGSNYTGNATTATTATNLTGPGVLSGTFSGSPTLSGSPVVSGSLVAANVNNIIAVDGTVYTTLFAAFSACPSVGCTIDMRGNSNAAALNLSTGFTSGIIDFGKDHSVTVLLGPFTYSLTQLVLESNTRIIGIGQGNSGTNHATTLNPSSSSTTPIIYNQNYVVQGVLLKGFRLLNVSGGSTSAGILIQPQANGNGLWYSEFDDICVGPCGPTPTGDFAGGSIVFDGTSGGTPNSVNQFNNFNRVQAFHRNNAGHYAFWAKGQNAQFTFNNCQFDGDINSPGGTNIWMGDGVSGLANVGSTFSFNELTTQWADVAVNIAGFWKATFHQTHIEGSKGVFKFDPGATNSATGIDIEDSYIASSGQNSGNGYIIDFTSTAANGSSVMFNCNYLTQTPDALQLGTNAVNVTWMSCPNTGYGGNTSAVVPVQLPSIILAGGIYRNQNNLASSTLTGLGAASASPGAIVVISDSTAVTAEGQVCAGSSTHKALAFSDGTQWKCF